MSKINPNDPATPCHSMEGGQMSVDTNRRGLTIRQELAARFMTARIQGLTADGMYGMDNDEQIVRFSFSLADDFIRVNNEQEEQK